MTSRQTIDFFCLRVEIEKIPIQSSWEDGLSVRSERDLDSSRYAAQSET